MVVLGACSASRVPASPIAIGPDRFALPAANWQQDGQTLLCAGGGWPGATIHGSPDDPLVVWVSRGGEKLRLAWPYGGYVARFTPSLEVLGPSGNVVFREGDEVAGGCETADRGIWQVDPRP